MGFGKMMLFLSLTCDARLVRISFQHDVGDRRTLWVHVSACERTTILLQLKQSPHA